MKSKVLEEAIIFAVENGFTFPAIHGYLQTEASNGDKAALRIQSAIEKAFPSIVRHEG